MASKIAKSDRVKSNRCSNASENVRVIGKIRDFIDLESKSLNQDSKPWVTVQKPQENESSEKVKVFFDNQSSSRKDVYELDYCYGQDEEIDVIYSREIRPIISEVFNGRNASIVALGAKGSGKTYTIQGSQEKPGLAAMAMSEILAKAEEYKRSVSISLYEVSQDHAYDLLDPKFPEIQVLEDGRGKIILKGLSQVPVKSISEFHKLYFCRDIIPKSQKTPVNQHRNHKGLMVHILSEDDKTNPKTLNKINFVDLAGYEDPRKSSKDGTTSNRSNKSLYALLNVVSALNANETRLPYRESKLTRILQDSFGGTSCVLMLNCLNPSFCQDSISSISLVTRSCRTNKQVLAECTNMSKSASKLKVFSSSKSGKTFTSLSVQKQLHSAKKTNTTISKGRKLLNEEKPTIASEFKSIIEFNLTEEPKEDVLVAQSMPEVQHNLSTNVLANTDTTVEEMDTSPPGIPNISSDTKALVSLEAGIEKNDTPNDNEVDRSPPLSERLKQISDNLKSLYTATPLSVVKTEEMTTPLRPIESNGAICYTPRGAFGNCSAGVKQSLVQECLEILNSANKEGLKSLKRIGEKRANYILELRQESPQPFKTLDDLQDIGMSAKEIKEMIKMKAGELFN